MADFVKDEFIDSCVGRAVGLGVWPEYVLAVAQARSGMKDQSGGSELGPFGLTKEQWNANLKDPDGVEDFLPEDIADWRMHAQLFPGMVSRDQAALHAKLARDFSMAELYCAEFPAVTPEKATGVLTAALLIVVPLTEAALKKLKQQQPVTTDPTKPITSGGGAMPDGAGGILGQLISSGEGDYNSFNRGVAGDAKGAKIDFSKMTLASIMTEQARPKGDPQRLFAVGKYQVIPDTMKDAQAALNLNTSNLFTPRVQEEIFRRFLVGSKRPPVKNFITGKSDNLAAAQLALAQEFASVADPNTGKSFFDKQAGNSSSITAAQSAKALNDERAAFAKLVAAGKSESDAWLALSPGLA